MKKANKSIKLNKKLNKNGIGLVEALAALTIAIIVITSLVSLSVFTLRTSNRGALLLKASKEANSQLELIRAYRDGRPWQQFIDDLEAIPCIDDGAGTFDPLCHIDLDTGESGGEPFITLVAGEQYGELPEGISNQGTPFESAWAFEASDVDGGVINDTTQVVRITVRVRWKIGAEDSYSYLYTDVSNWQGQ